MPNWLTSVTIPSRSDGHSPRLRLTGDHRTPFEHDARRKALRQTTVNLWRFQTSRSSLAVSGSECGDPLGVPCHEASGTGSTPYVRSHLLVCEGQGGVASRIILAHLVLQSLNWPFRQIGIGTRRTNEHQKNRQQPP